MDDAREAPVVEYWLDEPACTAYRRRVLGFLRKREVSDSDLDDLTQTVLSKVLPKDRAFPSAGARDGYVLKTAENVWKDYVKQQQRSTLVSLDEELLGEGPRSARITLTTAEPSALERVLRNEKQAALDEAIQALPTRMRACVTQRIHQGRELREIAAALRIDVNTVKSHLGQAREILRERLGRKFGIIAIE